MKGVVTSDRRTTFLDMDVDPLLRFSQAYERARGKEPFDVARAALATADSGGRPSVRFVLVKEFDARGFAVYTNYESDKARDLAANPYGALAWHWHTTGEQIRVSGPDDLRPRGAIGRVLPRKAPREPNRRLGFGTEPSPRFEGSAHRLGPGGGSSLSWRGGASSQPLGRLSPRSRSVRVLAGPSPPASRPVGLRSGRRGLGHHASRSVDSRRFAVGRNPRHSPPMRLVDALRSLDAARFDELLLRRQVVVHPERKADVIEQAARALAYPPVLETQSRWTPELREAASSLAVRPEGVHRGDLGSALTELLERDLVLVDASGRVHMPGAYRFQILPSPLDPPRRLRVLLHGISDPELRDIEKVHTGRRTTLPRALVADELLHRFENSEQVASSLRGLTPEGRRLLRAVDARGGELSTSDIQALSHDPRRYVVAPGARLSASSMSYELVRGGFLIPTKPGIYTVPDEVGEVVGKKRRSAVAAERAAVLDRVRCEDLSPARARIAPDPGPRAVCLLALLRRAGARLKADAGAPRSRVKQVGGLLGLSEREAEILVALARAADLPHDGAPTDQVTTQLFECWLRGGGWDEGRDPEDAFRAGPRLARVRSGLEGLRPTVVSLLRSLPATRFAPLEDLVDVIERDPLTKTVQLARAEALRRAPDAFSPVGPRLPHPGAAGGPARTGHRRRGGR